MLEIGEHLKEHTIEKKKVQAKTRRDFTDLYIRENNRFICAGCGFVYQSDRGVHRHLISTSCGFGDKERSPPKLVYKDLYIREGSRWTCKNCKSGWTSDRGIRKHLQITHCGFGSRAPQEKNDYDVLSQMKDNLMNNSWTSDTTSLSEDIIALTTSNTNTNLLVDKGYEEVPLE